MTIKILSAPTGSGKTLLAALSAHNDRGNGSTPQDYGQKHSTWRPHQRETWLNLTSGVGRRVIAVCRTKNLQVHQYAEEYNFEYLTGRPNWPCVHTLNPGAMADECLYGSKMRACEKAQICPYLIQKHKVQDANLASLNYAYFMTSYWPRQSLEKDTDAYLFADECHELSELIIGHVSTTVTRRDRKDYGLPRFPRLVGKSANKLMAGTGKDIVGPALVWLNQCLPIMKDFNDEHEYNMRQARQNYQDVVKTGLKGSRLLPYQQEVEKASRQFKRTSNIFSKIERTLEAIEENRDDWYICSGPSARQVTDRQTGRPKTEPGFICKPLTAKHFYKHFFEHGQRTILMSATIGGIEQYTEELGLSSDEYEFLSVPNQFTPEQRPVYVLDTPAMGAKKPKESWAEFNARFDAQADAIAQAIHDCPSDWPGIIHVSRKSEAKYLADRLAKRGLAKRVWPFTGHGGEQYVPTDEQVKDWTERKQSVPNSIGISWSTWEGFDGLDERICIVAKSPFPLWGSPGTYEESWRKYSNRRYRWTAACKLAQGLGRTRRGRPEDYDTSTEKRGLVAIADKSWTQCKKYLPQDILDAVQDY